MQNETVIKLCRQTLKDLLNQCTEPQQLLFMRMYSHKNLEAPIDEVVDKMDPSKLDWAITQCENTLKKKK